VNYIFDVGNVLVDYRPKKYLGSLFSDGELVEKLYTLVFGSPEWLEMDKGLLSFNNATEIFCSREPQYQKEIRTLMKHVNRIFDPIEETIDLLPKIKEAGHSLYYLSNIQFEVRDYLLKTHDFFTMFDGGVFSCDINHIKPSPEIYRHLLKKYSLNPADCIFFDDMKENVTAAEKENIKSILFTTPDCISEFI